MKKQLHYSSLFLLLLLALMVACEKDYTTQTNPGPPPPAPGKSFVEEFDTVANLSAKGWLNFNRSFPYGGHAWRQGKYELGGKFGNEIVGFPAFSAKYEPTEFISADLSASDGAGQISCWLISPPIPAKNGDVFSFYTRSTGNFPERLQLRANFSSESTAIANGPAAIGDFSELLIDIDPNYLGLYPAEWTKYSISFTGIPTAATTIRVAFRYMVDDTGVNGEMIGIDKVEFISK